MTAGTTFKNSRDPTTSQVTPTAIMIVPHNASSNGIRYLLDRTMTFRIDPTDQPFRHVNILKPSRVEDSKRQAADEALVERIRVVHDDDNTYGAPRITAELNDGVPEQDRVNHKRVARVMRGAGITGYRRRRRVKTTTPDPANQKQAGGAGDARRRNYRLPAATPRQDHDTGSG